MALHRDHAGSKDPVKPRVPSTLTKIVHFPLSNFHICQFDQYVHDNGHCHLARHCLITPPVHYRTGCASPGGLRANTIENQLSLAATGDGFYPLPPPI